MEPLVKVDEGTNLMHIPGYKDIHDSQLILRLEGEGNYTRLYLTDKHVPLLISQTLKYFEPVLPHFIRIHKSALINPVHIREVIDEGSKQLHLLLADGTISEVSRRRIRKTKAKLFNYQYDGNKRIWVVRPPNQSAPPAYSS